MGVTAADAGHTVVYIDIVSVVIEPIGQLATVAGQDVMVYVIVVQTVEVVREEVEVIAGELDCMDELSVTLPGATAEDPGSVVVSIKLVCIELVSTELV